MTATTHPHPGALRAALDGERPDLEAHIAGCAACAATQRGLRGDAAAVTALLDVLGAPPDVDVDAAARATRAAGRTPEPVADLAARRGTRRPGSDGWRSRAAALVVVLAVGGLTLATPAGQAAARGVLDTFRSERLQVVTLDPGTDLTGLDALSEVAVVEGVEQAAGPQVVEGLDEAEALSGIRAEPLDRASLPGPVAELSTTVYASAPTEVRVRFDTARRPDLPARLDGVTLVVDVPGVTAIALGGEAGDPAAASDGLGVGDTLVRATAGTLEIGVEGGLTLDEVRDEVLAVPGLSPTLVAQLRGLDDWQTTLPLPIPAGVVDWRDTTVEGNPAIAFGDGTGLGGALVWRDGDRTLGVAGTFAPEELRRVAENGGSR